MTEKIVHLPILLAGPVLRRAEPEQVCIWVACSRPVTIKAEIFRFDDELTIPVFMFILIARPFVRITCVFVLGCRSSCHQQMTRGARHLDTFYTGLIRLCTLRYN